MGIHVVVFIELRHRRQRQLGGAYGVAPHGTGGQCAAAARAAASRMAQQKKLGTWLLLGSILWLKSPLNC